MNNPAPVSNTDAQLPRHSRIVVVDNDVDHWRDLIHESLFEQIGEDEVDDHGVSLLPPPAEGARVDEAASASFLTQIWRPGDVRELRLIKPGCVPERGFFDNPLDMAREAAQRSGERQVYFTLNPVAPALLARAHNTVTMAPTGASTSDADIVERRFIPFDFDPVKSAGHRNDSSTAAEHARTMLAARDVAEYFESIGLPQSIIASSGNGAHLLLPVELPNTHETTILVERIVRAVKDRFVHPGVTVDTSVTNASRIWKLPGTLAIKGTPHEDRPHRVAYVIAMPNSLPPAPLVALQALAAAGQTEQRATDGPAVGRIQVDDGRSWSAERIRSFLHQHGIGFNHEHQKADGTVQWDLMACPFAERHSGDDASGAYVMRLPDGAIAAGCQHAGCREPLWRWQDLRSACEPDYAARQRESAPDAAEFAPWLSLDELLNSPAPEPLVEGLLHCGTNIMLSGSSGDGKTFLALDLALSVATGNDWHGRSVRKGPVLYIAAEAADEVARRARTWLDFHDVDRRDADIRFYPEEVGLMDRMGIERFAEQRLAFPTAPALIVIDTLSNCIGGADENGQKDMSLARDNINRIRRAAGNAAVLLVHHTGWDKKHERGSTVWRAWTDTSMMLVHERSSDVRTLKCMKNRRGQNFVDIDLRLHSIVSNGESTCVVRLDSDLARSERRPTGSARKILAMLHAVGADGARPQTIYSTAGIDRSTWDKCRPKLQADGLIRRDGAMYRITDVGRNSIGASVEHVEDDF